jgi:mycothiol synthase
MAGASAPGLPAGVALRPLDPGHVSDDVVRGLRALLNELRAEVDPSDPPPSDEAARLLVEARTQVREYDIQETLAWAGLRAVGRVFTALPRTSDNRHLLQVTIAVATSQRRRGLGWALLGVALDTARREERRLILFETSDRVPAGEAFARAVGAAPGLPLVIGELDLRGVDRDVLERWTREGPVRAAGYELTWIPRPIPEAMLEPMAALKRAMNTAPRGELDVEDREYTAQSLREMDAYEIAAGWVPWTLVARHVASGELVGFTELVWRPDQPGVVMQGDTAVLPEHRGHALGKWLKAVALERLLGERPQAQVIRTGNATTNEAMLGINRALGFVPVRATTVWQVDTEQVRRACEARMRSGHADDVSPRSA